MSSERWSRLQKTLADAGITIEVDSRGYQEMSRGRVQNGRSYSARIVLEDGRHITITDKWWRKNTDVWIGWAVIEEDTLGYIARQRPLTKKRSEVVSSVQALLPVKESK